MKDQPFTKASANIQHLLATRSLVRAVNFHSTPRARQQEYRDQLAGLSKDFSSVTEEDLDHYLTTGKWRKSKPGMIIAIYEGYRNGYDVMLPLLEEFNLTGWFFVITEFIKSPAMDQLSFARAHDIGIETLEYADGRYALSWPELKRISRSHVVASHGRTHVSLGTLDRTARESEVFGSQSDFEQHLSRRVQTFVSYGGPAQGEDITLDAMIEQAGYRFVFSNLKIQRIRSVK